MNDLTPYENQDHVTTFVPTPLPPEPEYRTKSSYDRFRRESDQRMDQVDKNISQLWTYVYIIMALALMVAFCVGYALGSSQQ